ncbi:MAG: AAA family ATPase [Acidimicrobiaceae bacterium]|nr:AAA family ATPase [Acidimicrobiaceae bacterium]
MARPVRGRKSELATLGGLVEAAGAGEGGLAILEGPPGIGKSRLLAETIAFARERGLVVATGRADELDQMTPWGPLLVALSSTDPAIVSPADLKLLSGLADMRLEVLEHLRTALEGAARERPLLIAIDDLHWADPSTLLALGSLAPELFSYPIVWLLARRPFPTSSQMDALLDRLPTGDTRRLPLEPLDREATTALAADVLGRSPDTNLAVLVAQAEGNPLYIVEILRNAGDWQGVDGLSVSDRDARVARSLASTIAAHLRSVSETSKGVVRVASVLGRNFSVAELSAVTGQPASELLAPLTEALAADVLVEDGPQLAFRHELLRRGVYDDLPAALRPALHRQAATALLTLGAPVIRVANQLAFGALPGDEQAIEALGQASSDLFGTSPTAAADLSLRMLELIGPDDPRRPSFVATTVQMLGWAGRLGEARQLGDEYVAKGTPSLELAAEIQVGIVRAWAMSTTLPYPTPLQDRLMTDPAVPEATRGRLIAFDAMGSMLTQPEPTVDRALRTARRLVAGSGDETDLAVVEAVRVALATEHGQLADAVRIAELPVGTTEGPLSVRATGLQDMEVARVLTATGEPAAALEAIARALDAATSSGFTVIVSGCQAQRAAALLELGRLEDARAEARSAAETGHSLGFGYFLGLALVTSVESCIRQGDLAEARVGADRLAALSPDEPTGDSWWAAALCADAEGHPDEAVRALAPMLERLGQSRFQSVVYFPDRLPRLVDLAMRAGAGDEAVIAAQAAAELGRRNPDVPVAVATATYARGLLESDPAALAEAVAMLARGERPLATAAAREDLARVLIGPRARQEAVELLEAAYETYVQVGATHDTGRVRAALRSRGVRKRETRVARLDHGWESLTRSERAVADLVASGLTNREAASELYLSPYTINVHLRHVFSKLGIKSRVQLARLAAECR